ncbi:MAG TPA: ABC transporter permease, partial [Candidatus Mediterraneibacter pullistercoris]|nr:ABC transporter permease [Candidatus Mediterraneibacter pullistercoris]
TAEDKGSGSYSAGENEVVIPWNSVPENCWKDNIVGIAPMKGETTSFQIPNGTIEEFQEKWETLGIDDLEIRFYDMGYTQLKESLENRELMSAVFLVSGCVMAVMILCFFSSLFITGQRERITAERLMGQTKRKCALSILTGMFLLSAAGCIVGSAAGWMASEKAAESIGNTLEFDRTYSDNAVADAEPAEAPKPPGAGLPCATGAVLLAASAAVSAGYMGKTLRKEPLRMLGEIEE